MAPTAAHLRAAADVLRAHARGLDLTLAPLAGRASPATWEGPAATAFRLGARDVIGRVEGAGAALRATADRLDAAADRLDARARAAEEAREGRHDGFDRGR